jgi:hypothetical protein
VDAVVGFEPGLVHPGSRRGSVWIPQGRAMSQTAHWHGVVDTEGRADHERLTLLRELFDQLLPGYLDDALLDVIRRAWR